MTFSSMRRLLGAFGVAFLMGATPLFGQHADQPTAMPQTMTPTVFDNPSLVQHYQATITPEDLAAHLYIFASDYFEGRETGTRGQKLAANYLASQYRLLGLQPYGTMPNANPAAPEAYFQPVPLFGRSLTMANLSVSVGGTEVATSQFSAEGADGQMYLSFGNLAQSQGTVVFAGYGIGDADLNYDDYAALKDKNIDLVGKWVMVLRDEPMSDKTSSLLPTPDGEPSRWTRQQFAKLRAMIQGGLPAGVLIVGDIGPGGYDVAERAAREISALKEDVGSLSLSEQASSRSFPGVYVISSELANKILAPSKRTVAQIKAGIDKTLKPEVFEVADVEISSAISHHTSPINSENVLAFIEGSDPDLKDEVIVISSHYDHIGIEHGAEGDNINNGADDDGSGTVTTLEIAQAFMAAKADGYGPRRSILFLNVTGEEKGLLGSEYFTDMAPAVPLENIVTNLNIDMVGRFDPTHPTDNMEYVYIIGSNLISQELHDINQRVNTMTGINIDLHERFNSKDDPNQFYRRSDHWNFGKNDIPFIFFFTGTHDDYHGLDDEPDRIEYDRMARIGRVIFATAWQVANQETRPAVSGEGFK